VKVIEMNIPGGFIGIVKPHRLRPFSGVNMAWGWISDKNPHLSFFLSILTELILA
jgi:hypothetical protein